MGSHAVVVPPVRPAALLSFILARCAHPTTLVVCSTSTDFVQRCVYDDATDETDETGESDRRGDTMQPLHTASLLQVAVARHIRVAFVPTVAHLRGFLAAFDLAASRVPAPPQVLISDSNSISGSNSKSSSNNNALSSAVNRGDCALVVYDFVRLHKGTSEWSGQGLSASAAVLAEAGWRTGLDVLVVESGALVEDETSGTRQGSMLDKRAPVLSTAARKQLQRAGYPLRTERVRSVLARWFTLRQQLDEWRQMAEPGDSKEEEGTKTAVLEEQADAQSVEQGQAERGANEKDEKEASSPEEADKVAAADEQEVGTTNTVQARPVRTFVKDSEDEDDGLSDDEMLTPNK
ncbi:MAG: hypothetical protein STHCBS139747_005903 [Sporothrix thermara]